MTIEPIFTIYLNVLHHRIATVECPRSNISCASVIFSLSFTAKLVALGSLLPLTAKLDMYTGWRSYSDLFGIATEFRRTSRLPPVRLHKPQSNAHVSLILQG